MYFVIHVTNYFKKFIIKNIHSKVLHKLTCYLEPISTKWEFFLKEARGRVKIFKAEVVKPNKNT